VNKQEVKQCENYHCSVEQEGESTAQSCLDGKRSAMSSGKATRKKSLPKESKMESSTAHQSSAMSEHSSVKGTPEHIAEWLKSLAVDFLANPSQSQENEQPAMMLEICGRQQWTLSEKSSQPLCTLRTYPDYSAQQWTTPQGDLFTTLERYSETWPKAGMTVNGQCWELTMLAQHTIANDCGLEGLGEMLPTPSAGKTTLSGDLVNSDGSEWDGVSKPHSARTGSPVQTTLQDKIQYMPTPSTMDFLPARSREAQIKMFERARKGRSAPSNLREWVHPETWPTPQAHDQIKTSPNQKARDSLRCAIDMGRTKNKIFEQSEGEKGTLNPNWVELLMGWPMGASSLEPMSKDTFNDWLNGYPFNADWERDVPRVTTGIENRAKRLKAIGNGQVSLSMAVAYRILEATA